MSTSGSTRSRMPTEIADLLPQLDRWLDTQRVGLSAHIFAALSSEFVEQEGVFDLLHAQLTDVPIQKGWSRPGFLRQLAPSTLDALARAIEIRGRPQELTSQIEEVLHWQLSSDSPPPYVRAQIWSYHLLLGATSPRQLARLGRSLFKDSWKDLE